MYEKLFQFSEIMTVKRFIRSIERPTMFPDNTKSKIETQGVLKTL